VAVHSYFTTISPAFGYFVTIFGRLKIVTADFDPYAAEPWRRGMADSISQLIWRNWNGAEQ
jgi:hypothetical protein